MRWLLILALAMAFGCNRREPAETPSALLPLPHPSSLRDHPISEPQATSTSTPAVAR